MTKNPTTSHGDQSLMREGMGGLLSTLSSVPQTVPFGVLIFAPFGAEGIITGVYSSILSAIVGSFVVCLLSPVKTQIAGPRSATSLVLVAFSAWMAGQGSDLRLGLVLMTLSVLFGGLAQFALGKARLAGFVRLVPYPVLVGFTAGLALSLAWSQIPLLFGYSADRSVLSVRPWIDGSFWPLPTIIATLVIYFGLARFRPKWPALGYAFVGGLLTEVVLGVGVRSETVVAPAMIWPQLPLLVPDSEDAARLLAFLSDPSRATTFFMFTALIAMISTIETLLSLVTIDGLLDRITDPNEELVAHGASNVLVAFAGGITSAGSMARTLVNHQAGARGKTSVMIHCLMMTAFLFFKDPVATLPIPVMAGIMLIVAYGMIDPWIFRILRSLKQNDVNHALNRDNLGVVLLTLGFTLFSNPLIGVFMGTLASALVFLRHMSRPVLRAVRDANSEHSRRMRPLSQIEALSTLRERVLVANVEGPIFFGTASALRSWSLAPDGGRPQRAEIIIFDFSAAGDVDTTGALIISQIAGRLSGEGRHVAISGLKPGDSRKDLIADFDGRGAIAFFPDLDLALEWAEDRVLLAHGVAADHDAVVLSPITSGLSQSDEACINAIATSISIRAGDVLFRQGASDDSLYVLRSGLIRIELDGSPPIRVLTIAAGVVFGEMSLLDQRPRSASAIAQTDCILQRISRPDVEMLRAQRPALAAELVLRLARELAHRLRATNAILESANRRSR